MRKQVFGRQLGRNKNQRKALFRGLVNSFIEKGEIQTTLIKAKSVKPLIEKLITKAKRASLSDRRELLKKICRRDLVNRLTDQIAPLFKEKNGGYLRMVRIGIRRGDVAPMAKLILTEELKEAAKEPEKELPKKAKKGLEKEKKNDKTN